MGYIGKEELCHILKAAGTPIMRALALISSLRFTVLPGDFSTRITSGIGSPTLTGALAELRKERAREPVSKSCRRTRAAAIITD